ncbi:MAG: hypothetical protein HQM02_02060 [Magnetococcales bacterium]|nr:hypothetical protein [Magnetococcales bacterium]
MVSSFQKIVKLERSSNRRIEIIEKKNAHEDLLKKVIMKGFQNDESFMLSFDGAKREDFKGQPPSGRHGV